MQPVRPWLADAARRPGARLIWASTAGLAVLGLATFYVSFRAQFTFMYAVKHQDAPALIEALIADVAMVVCSLLALGSVRVAGQAAVSPGHPGCAEAGSPVTCRKVCADVNDQGAESDGPARFDSGRSQAASAKALPGYGPAKAAAVLAQARHPRGAPDRWPRRTATPPTGPSPRRLTTPSLSVLVTVLK